MHRTTFPSSLYNTVICSSPILLFTNLETEPNAKTILNSLKVSSKVDSQVFLKMCNKTFLQNSLNVDFFWWFFQWIMWENLKSSISIFTSTAAPSSSFSGTAICAPSSAQSFLFRFHFTGSGVLPCGPGKKKYFWPILNDYFWYWLR